MSTSKNILVTGGAGFIGSNIVGTLLEDERTKKVIVLDNLSTGYFTNIQEYENHKKFEFVKGDIRNFELCDQLCQRVDLICHQAALGSIPRSVENPAETNDVNVSGSVNLMWAAVKNSVKRIVFASSSSVYGEEKSLPKVEEKIGQVFSPYALSKQMTESYAKIFSQLYALEFIGLRYFNVFGPKQNSKGPYSSVIPLFIKAALNNQQPKIYGNGEQSRDFTYVENAVEANIQALFSSNENNLNQFYNIGCEMRTSVNEVWKSIKNICQSQLDPIYHESRSGDVMHSFADITKAKDLLKYNPQIKLNNGLLKTINWFKNEK